MPCGGVCYIRKVRIDRNVCVEEGWGKAAALSRFIQFLGRKNMSTSTRWISLPSTPVPLPPPSFPARASSRMQLHIQLGTGLLLLSSSSSSSPTPPPSSFPFPFWAGPSCRNQAILSTSIEKQEEEKLRYPGNPWDLLLLLLMSLND